MTTSGDPLPQLQAIAAKLGEDLRVTSVVALAQDLRVQGSARRYTQVTALILALRRQGCQVTALVIADTRFSFDLVGGLPASAFA